MWKFFGTITQWNSEDIYSMHPSLSHLGYLWANEYFLGYRLCEVHKQWHVLTDKADNKQKPQDTQRVHVILSHVEG